MPKLREGDPNDIDLHIRLMENKMYATRARRLVKGLVITPVDRALFKKCYGYLFVK